MQTGLFTIMMSQGRFINCNKCTTSAGDTDSWRGYGGYACMVVESSVPSAQLCCEPKTALFF